MANVRVVLDTNVWVSEHLLRSPLGAALVYRVRQLDARLVLPEVVEVELEHQAHRRAEEAVDKVRKALDEVRRWTGAAPEPSLPNADRIEVARRDTLADLDAVLERVPYTLDYAHRALLRVVRKVPPNERNEQYRDSAIWEAALDAADSAEVHFVTRDTGFYRGHDPKQGPHPTLVEEAGNRRRAVHVHGDLAGCVGALEAQAPGLDYAALGSALATHIRPEVEAAATSAGFQVGDERDHQVRAFITEQPTQIAVSFTLRFLAEDTETGADVVVEVEGEATLNTDENSFGGVTLRSIRFWQDGERRAGGLVYLSARGIIGTPVRPWSVRRELPRPQVPPPITKR